MADATVTHAIPYPDPADPNDVPGDMQALAERVDTLLLIRDDADVRYLRRIGGSMEGGVDFAGHPIEDAELRDAYLRTYSERTIDHGITSGALVIDVADAPVHVVQANGTLDVTFAGWPGAGRAASVTLIVATDGNAITLEPGVTWPDGEPPEVGAGRCKLVFDRAGEGPIDGQLVGKDYA